MYVHTTRRCDATQLLRLIYMCRVTPESRFRATPAPPQRCWTHPGSKHFLVVAKRVVHSACRLGRRMRPDRRRVVQLVILLLGHGRHLSLWGIVVLHLGQGHSDAQTFVPEKLSETSLPPSSGCRCVSITNRRQHDVSD